MSVIPDHEIRVYAPATGPIIDLSIGVWKAANSGSELVQHPERLRTWASHPASRLVAAYDGDAMIGMLVNMVGRADDGFGPPVSSFRHLAGVSVLPDHWGRGVGRRMLQATLADVQAANVRVVTLWARRGNGRADRLFKSVGFRLTGRTQPDEVGHEMLHYRYDHIRPVVDRHQGH
jgi:ribosomal protein S18 acetylase RimI-like enzyme